LVIKFESSCCRCSTSVCSLPFGTCSSFFLCLC
uniref:Ovule protein n=1 Tax=Haemonchus placei TaxID=6290 RepID=A0A0N4WLY1_HAEPC